MLSRVLAISGSSFALAVMLSGCSGVPQSLPIGGKTTEGAVQSRVLPSLPASTALGPQAVVYKSLYSFKGYPVDGFSPLATLTVLNGTLFGTTVYGGKTNCINNSGQIVGCGSDFKVTTAGVEHMIHSFSNYPNDGADPYGGLLVVNGQLYGAASLGGTTAATGIFYSLSPSGTEKVLYQFEGVRGQGYPADAASPDSGLLSMNGELYGTTNLGGNYGGGYGTVYKISTTGKEQLVYSFESYPDGEYPYAGVISVGGTLYGATYEGGTSFSGMIFSVTTSGTEKPVYSFTGYPYGPDGLYPFGGLIAINGTLYGTTVYGGASGNGAVYAVTTAGKEHIVYSFKGKPDGANPYSTLVAVNGLLYGTTAGGGASGNGTVFSVNPTSGVEHALYSFKGQPDGAAPWAGLTYLNGVFYGTTTAGGKSNNGTVFSLHQ